MAPLPPYSVGAHYAEFDPPQINIKKNAPTVVSMSIFFGGEEGRTPVREGKPGTSTGLVMRGICREPVAA